jgi:hypothetical protein
LIKGLAFASDLAGLSGLASALRNLDQDHQAVVLDGLLALWHPEASAR